MDRRKTSVQAEIQTSITLKLSPPERENVAEVIVNKLTTVLGQVSPHWQERHETLTCK